jgi:TFIIF-interacting CTD phosphatase-like protein
MHKLNILLDLDQTLIASEYLDKFEKKTHSKALQSFKHKYLGKEFVIFARPNLDEFLDFLFANFNVSVWTAASRDYGVFIVENFILTKPNRQIDFFFYSYHTNLAIKNSKKLKDLSMIWNMFKLSNYNTNNTFIIDDNERVYNDQPDNTIRIKEFNYDDPASFTDSELPRIKRLLQRLSKNK